MNKGQVAFESLILLLVIISASIYITGLFFSTQEVTMTYSIARTKLVEQINYLQKDATIESLNLQKGTTNTLYITTIPPNLTNTDFNLEIIEKEIKDNTNLDNITIQIN